MRLSIRGCSKRKPDYSTQRVWMVVLWLGQRRHGRLCTAQGHQRNADQIKARQIQSRRNRGRCREERISPGWSKSTLDAANHLRAARLSKNQEREREMEANWSRADEGGGQGLASRRLPLTTWTPFPRPPFAAAVHLAMAQFEEGGASPSLLACRRRRGGRDREAGGRGREGERGRRRRREGGREGRWRREGSWWRGRWEG